LSADKSGFTLLEVLGAVAILGISLALLFEVFGHGLRNTARLESVSDAVVASRSLLDRALLHRNPEDATESGDLPDGLRYRITTAVVAETERQRLFRITVEVFRPGAGSRAAVVSALRNADVEEDG